MKEEVVVFRLHLKKSDRLRVVYNKIYIKKNFTSYFSRTFLGAQSSVGKFNKQTVM